MLANRILDALSPFKPQTKCSLPRDLKVRNLTDNSLEVLPGSAFVAVKGGSFDGHAVLADVVERGCVLIIAQRGCVGDFAPGKGCWLIEVDDTRAAIAGLAAAWYGYPGRSMVMIGVTGTNGKTTCTWMMESILASAGFIPGVLGTVSYRYQKKGRTTVLQDAPLTTPDPLTLNRTLRLMADAGVTHVVMEVSSHALDQKRLGAMLFDVAVFTNLSRDHLDYHHNLEEYFVAKQQLFSRHLKDTGRAVIADGEQDEAGNWTERLVEVVKPGSVLLYGVTSSADIRAVDVVQDENGTTCRLVTPGAEVSLSFGLTGNFNVLNMLATAGVGVALGIPSGEICKGISSIHSVPGRLERVSISGRGIADGPAVFVDYAHTPDALEKVLSSLKELCDGRLICVFGCGGDRDRGKRPEMGRAAGEYADIVVVTSDNPRGEEPKSIMADILPGVKSAGMERCSDYGWASLSELEGGFIVESDRSKAIRLALDIGKPDDLILIAGKGHEAYQIIGGARRYFDDRTEAMNAMIAWNLETLCEAVGGRVVSGKQSIELKKVSTDSRKIDSGDIFVALKGEQFDGHSYVEAAVQKGAAAVVVGQPCEVTGDVPVVQVSDTLRALGSMAAYRRDRLRQQLTVVGITGSSGKTTVKEMTAAIFSLHWPDKLPGQVSVLKTQGNYNNLIGLPLSLLPVEAQHKAAILEMGMNSFGEIEQLATIADPDIGCITNVQPAHLLGLGSVEGVAKAKGELFHTMRAGAVRVVNLDDALVRGVAKSCGGNQVGFAVTAAGRKHKPAVRVTRANSLGELGTRFTLELEGEKARVTLKVPGMHNVSDAAAAAAIAFAAGIPLDTIVAGLEKYTAFDKRLVVKDLPGGVRVVNDTYNANPASMAAALKTVSSFGSECRRVAALGDMLELGDASRGEHRRIGELVAQMRYTALAVTGEFAPDVAAGATGGGMSADAVYVFKTPLDIASWLYHQVVNGVLGKNDWILAKGSRGMRMETMIEELERLLTP